MPPGTGDGPAGPDGYAGQAGGSIEDLPGSRMGAGGGHVADLELERLEAAERPAGEAGDDVDAVALRERRGEIGRPKAMPSITSRSRRRTSWVWPPLAARTRCTVSPRTATSGSGFPGPHGASRARSRYSA